MNTVLCSRGHEQIPENVFGKNQCKICHKLSVATYEKTETCRKYRKQWAASPKRKAYAKAYYQTHKEQSKISHLKQKYGLSIEAYNHLLSLQQGKCAVCGIPGVETPKGLVVDHNHKTGQVRGLLCNICNSHIIHVLEDYPHLIDKAKTYLGL